MAERHGIMTSQPTEPEAELDWPATCKGGEGSQPGRAVPTWEEEGIWAGGAARGKKEGG